jgi:hypothetical protein
MQTENNTEILINSVFIFCIILYFNFCNNCFLKNSFFLNCSFKTFKNGYKFLKTKKSETEFF